MAELDEGDIVDEEKAKVAIDAFSAINETLNKTKESDMFAGIAPITKVGIITKTPFEIMKGLEKAYDTAKAEETSLRELLHMQISKDEEDEDRANGIRNPHHGGGGGGKEKPEKPTEPTTPETPITKPELTNAIVELTPGALSGFMEELQALATREKVTLDQLLKDAKYADLLKALFAEWDVPLTLISAILGSKEPSQFLIDLIAGKAGLVIKDEYLSTLKNKLQKIANDNNITLEQLLTDAKYSSILKQSLENISKGNSNLKPLIDHILKSEDSGKSLKSIFNGTSTDVFTESEYKQLKGYLEETAKANNITLDQLLNDPKNSGILNAALEKAKGNETILGAMNSMSKEDAQGYLADLVAGKYPEAFGLNSRTQDATFDYLSGVAQKNNITVETLMTDSKYSNLLQTELKNYSNTTNYVQEQLSGKTTEQMQTWLRDAYNGGTEGMNTSTIENVRNYVDSLAAQNNMSGEDLIMNPANATVLQNGLADTAKTSVFLSNTSTYQGTSTQTIMNNFYNTKFESSTTVTTGE